MVFSLVDDQRHKRIEKLVKEVAHLDGDMAELGVYKGGTAYTISQANPHKCLHLFDNFVGGLPHDDIPEGHHKKGEFACSMDEVETALGSASYWIHDGYFPDTTKDCPHDQQFCFVHLDADLYQSTKDGIEYFWPRLVKDGIICFDDFLWPHCPGVAKAIKECLPHETIFVNPIQCHIRKG
jgi:O-methyltransferase